MVDNTENETIKMLIGNKSDLERDEKLKENEVQDFCIENGLMYWETSAKNGKNVNEAFIEVVKKIYEK